MNAGDWLTLAGLLSVQAGGLVAFLLRIEGRLARLEALAEAQAGGRVVPMGRRA